MSPQGQPIRVRVEGLGVVEFPAGTNEATMQRALADQMQRAASQPARPPTSPAVMPTPDIPIQTGVPGVTVPSGFVTGLVKGAGTTASTLAQLTPPAVVARLQGQPLDIPQPSAPATSAERAGFAMEQLGEFFIPLGFGTRALAIVPKAWRGIRWAVRPAVEAAEMGARVAAQGADTEDVMTAALLGGAATPLVKTAEAVGKVFGQALPERLYSQVFKYAQDDLERAYRSAAKGGKPDPTLAKELLDRGLWGSSKNMAVYAYRKLDELERELQHSLTGKSLRLPQKQDYAALLEGLAEDFGGAFSKMGKDAASLLARLKQGIRGPYISATNALSLKRLLDRARQTSAFRMSAKLSPKQDEYKEAADLVRGLLHQAFPEASTLLNEERVFIQAADAIVGDAMRRQNRKLLGLTDYILGGGGMASGYGVSGVGAAAAVRGFQNPFTLTALGQALARLYGVTPTASGAARTTIGATSVSTRKEY